MSCRDRGKEGGKDGWHTYVMTFMREGRTLSTTRMVMSLCEGVCRRGLGLAQTASSIIIRTARRMKRQQHHRASNPCGEGGDNAWRQSCGIALRRGGELAHGESSKKTLDPTCRMGRSDEGGSIV